VLWESWLLAPIPSPAEDFAMTGGYQLPFTYSWVLWELRSKLGAMVSGYMLVRLNTSHCLTTFKCEPDDTCAEAKRPLSNAMCCPPLQFGAGGLLPVVLAGCWMPCMI